MTATMDLRVGNKVPPPTSCQLTISTGSVGKLEVEVLVISTSVSLDPIDPWLTISGTNIISGEEIAIKLESTKAKHPQLEYEARVYKVRYILYFGQHLPFRHLLVVLVSLLFAGSALNATMWVILMVSADFLECDGNRFTWSLTRGFIQLLQSQILSKNSSSPRRPTGTLSPPKNNKK